MSDNEYNVYSDSQGKASDCDHATAVRHSSDSDANLEDTLAEKERTVNPHDFHSVHHEHAKPRRGRPPRAQ